MCHLQSTTRCERDYIENFFSPVIKMVALLKILLNAELRQNNWINISIWEIAHLPLP